MALDFSEVLVTGGAGFIGSHIVDRLIAEGVKVRVLDNISAGEKQNISHHNANKLLKFIEGDIQNFETAKKATKGVDAVIHEAALVSVTRSVEDPILSNNINVKGSLNMLKAAVDTGVKRFVLASSCAVYGDTVELPNKENSQTKPLSPYAVDKLAVENYAKVFHELYGLETVSLRYFNVYGPRQKPGPYSGVISVFVSDLLQKRAPTVYGDGEQKRDFVNVKDVVEANILGLTTKRTAGEVFNVGTGKPVTINRLVEILQKITDTAELKPEYTKPRTGDVKYSYGDITKIKKLLGFEPKIGLEDGLKELVNWSKNRL
jgi:nucleoside-diphosphate-sugar epimerase